MNKHKLIQIIIKDLEELKTLTTEVAESESDSSLIIDLALSRARLLCQEIELLKEVSVKTETSIEETEKESVEEAEEESSDLSFSDPELEIINFEEREFPETEELQEEVEEEEVVVYNSDEEETEEDSLNEEDLDEMEEDESSPEELPAIDDEPDLIEEEKLDIDQEEEELEKDDEATIELEEEDLDAEDYELEEENEFETEEVSQPESTVQVNELKPDFNSGIREIQIEDLDEEETEPIHFTPASAPASRPVMREIPKPEDAQKEKQVLGETFQKERSLNDAIGENKSVEPNLGNGPISSLRSSIGLNDRFLFIREIFSNNTDKYNMIIDHLDKLETIQEAVDYLKANLTLQKNDTSLKFVDLLKRRFTK